MARDIRQDKLRTTRAGTARLQRLMRRAQPRVPSPRC
jgi:hypothetical protein